MPGLSSDRPSPDPKDDLFGHAPFAEQLAKSIQQGSREDGLVLALHGPWGSGKTTVLGYVCHYLENGPSTDNDKTVVVHFNPWWFSGREDLARAFLGQLQAVLPGRSKKLEKLGNLLGDFAEGVGGLLDLTGWTGGFGKALGKIVHNASKKRPKNVPALKEQISDVLSQARVPILVVIDDIDRLDEGEVRQVFTVIKALADFPYVTYLLAFDREVAARAIERDSSLPGDRYLEKIVQVPFELPPVDELALRAALFRRLDEILINTPEGLFDPADWANVYFSGIDALIRVPRDVVRFTNTLSVTYPALVGEVNPVDFIAIEAIRVFIPNLYNVIRSNQDRFAGVSGDARYGRAEQAQDKFRENWINTIPEDLRASTIKLLERLFPKIRAMGYGTEWLAVWRRGLQVCHPDLFPAYFRLSLPSGAVSRQEVVSLVSSVGTPDVFKGLLVQAMTTRRPDGITKARTLLERLMDHVNEDIPETHIPIVISALLDIGDVLIDPADERGMFDFGTTVYIVRPIFSLLKRVPQADRMGVLEEAIRSGKALAVQEWLLSALEEEVEKAGDSGNSTLPSDTEVEHLKATWLEAVRNGSKEIDFVDRPELARVLTGWRRWGGDEEPHRWCEATIQDDQGLLRLVSQFLQHTKSQGMDDVAVRRRPRLRPSVLEPYVDIRTCAERLSHLTEMGEVPEWAAEAVSQFLLEFSMLERGDNPEGLDD